MTIPLHQRLRSRIARFLEHHYQRHHHTPPPPLSNAEETWQIVSRLNRQLQLASRWGYAAAQLQVEQRLAQSLRRLAKDCLLHAEDAERRLRAPEPPTFRLLMEELQSLDPEFGQVELDWGAKTLHVRTERIVLEGVDLGPFEIRLWLNQLSCHQPYAVLALDPCQPGCGDDITHPHVQSDVLCEGAGRPAIVQALEQGRIGEFFLLVAQVLRTYNPSSAYCSLADWHGSPCADCGDAVSQDDQSLCEACRSRLCDRCTHSCTGCDETLCHDCSSTCESCQGTTCDPCLSPCESCHDSICRNCLNDDLCPSCYDESQKDDHDEPFPEAEFLEPAAIPATASQTTLPPAEVAVQPDRLGEALVSS